MKIWNVRRVVVHAIQKWLQRDGLSILCWSSSASSPIYYAASRKQAGMEPRLNTSWAFRNCPCSR